MCKRFDKKHKTKREYITLGVTGVLDQNFHHECCSVGSGLAIVESFARETDSVDSCNLSLQLRGTHPRFTRIGDCMLVLTREKKKQSITSVKAKKSLTANKLKTRNQSLSDDSAKYV